ncbi:MAG: amidohydrolase [Bacteroidetes bacterium]|nr:MAG: amidohydrolase [Bacteroidota bacterium]
MLRFLLLISFALSFSSALWAQKSLQAEIDAAAARIQPEVVAWRRHLHEHPELGNREFQTAAYIEAHLRKLGLEVRTGVAKTGVVGILKGKLPGPVVGLRADMDGLPVAERVNIPFASKAKAEYNGQEVSVMHACGHDSHVAMLMGAAEVLSGMKDKVKGTVVFIFQPAEEGPPGDEEGGAPLMIKEGVMDNPKIDAIFGIHISAQLEIGNIEYRPGAFMASSDWFSIKVIGKQSHGSQPWNGIDPIVVATQIIQGLQTIVSRQENIAVAPVVITVGKINGGIRENIIPEDISFSGTIRTLDQDMQKDVHERIRITAQNIAEASGAKAVVDISTKTVVTYNDPELVKKMLPSLQKAAGGPAHVEETTWRTGAEDFSYYGLKAPAFFFNVGGMPAGKNPSEVFPHHTPDFYIDDSRLDVGVKAFCHLVFDYAEVAR